MKGVTFLPGVALASVLIGPAVAIGGMLVAAAARQGGVEMLLAAPFVVFFALMVGTVVSVLPNLAGAALLAWLGRDNIAVRLPVMWALAGAAAGAALVAAFGGGTADAGTTAIIAVIGTASALMCRWKTRWA